MTIVLNEDILTLVYSHVLDFEVLRATATATAINEQHPLRGVVLCRLLQLPLRLSSKDFDDSKALIVHLIHNALRAGVVQNIVVILGPSRKAIAERPPWQMRIADLKRADKADEFVKLLPELLKHTKNLRRLDWSECPPPNISVLKELSEHSAVTHLSLDCSAGSIYLPDPSRPLDAPDATAEIKFLFSSLGPKVTSLDLRNVDEDVFEVIKQDFLRLKNVLNLKLDLTCGVWDWDGRGSPQQGPSEDYRFSLISNHVQELDLTITDLLARKPKGPLELVNSRKLTKLTVVIIPCYAWICLGFVPLFSCSTGSDFSALTHLVIDDCFRDIRRWTIDRRVGEYDWKEDGRTYVGIHELIPTLPQLRHLWVSERVLAIPSFNNEDNIWDANPFSGESQEIIMSRTVASPYWEPLGCAFEKLESLRVGFGPLDARWATKVLSHCDQTKLKAFGFDWEWKPGSENPEVFSELIAALSRFELLTDLHILQPYAAIPKPVLQDTVPRIIQEIRRLHETEETKGLVKEFFSKLPGLHRVGIGRNSVWERQTRWKEGDNDEFFIQKLHRARAPSFYDAGSSNPFTDIVEFDEHPAVKDVLKLLKEL